MAIRKTYNYRELFTNYHHIIFFSYFTFNLFRT